MRDRRALVRGRRQGLGGEKARARADGDRGNATRSQLSTSSSIAPSRVDVKIGAELSSAPQSTASCAGESPPVRPCPLPGWRSPGPSSFVRGALRRTPERRGVTRRGPAPGDARAPARTIGARELAGETRGGKDSAHARFRAGGPATEGAADRRREARTPDRRLCATGQVSEGYGQLHPTERCEGIATHCGPLSRATQQEQSGLVSTSFKQGMRRS